MKYSKIHSKRSVKVESHQEATLRRKCSKVIHIKACITHTCKGEMTLNWIWACRAHSIKLNESLSSIKIFLLEVKYTLLGLLSLATFLSYFPFILSLLSFPFSCWLPFLFTWKWNSYLFLLEKIYFSLVSITEMMQVCPFSKQDKLIYAWTTLLFMVFMIHTFIFYMRSHFWH